MCFKVLYVFFCKQRLNSGIAFYSVEVFFSFSVLTLFFSYMYVLNNLIFLF